MKLSILFTNSANSEIAAIVLNLQVLSDQGKLAQDNLGELSSKLDETDEYSDLYKNKTAQFILVIITRNLCFNNDQN